MVVGFDGVFLVWDGAVNEEELEVRLCVAEISCFIEELNGFVKVLWNTHAFLAEHSRPVLSD